MKPKPSAGSRIMVYDLKSSKASRELPFLMKIGIIIAVASALITLAYFAKVFEH